MKRMAGERNVDEGYGYSGPFQFGSFGRGSLLDNRIASIQEIRQECILLLRQD